MIVKNNLKGKNKFSRKKICIVSTVPFVLNWFMAPHIKLLSQNFDITLVTSGTEKNLTALLEKHVVFQPIHIKRKIAFKSDVKTIFELWNFFRKSKFDCVHSIMPKSGLLAMIASRLSGIPFRLHTFTGQVWVTKIGVASQLLKLLDKVLVINATQIFADSHSQKKFLIKTNIVNEKKIIVFADGSIAGVDEHRFQKSLSVRTKIRSGIGISDKSIVFLFLGRLNKDKGILTLISAFAVAAKINSNIHLLVVGPDEDNLEIDLYLLKKKYPGRIHYFGVTDRPEDYMSASDVLCLPSFREGFPNVPLQAASMGLPTIASRIYGITDAVAEGETGILHTPGSEHEIVEAMLLLTNDQNMRKKMGESARTRILDKFTETRVTKELYDFYIDMLLN